MCCKMLMIITLFLPVTACVSFRMSTCYLNSVYLHSPKALSGIVAAVEVTISTFRVIFRRVGMSE